MKNKGIQVWKHLEVGALYQYTSCFGKSTAPGEAPCCEMYTVLLKPSTAECELITNGAFNDTEYVYSGDILVFLGSHSVFYKNTESREIFLCFLHPKTGKTIASVVGDCFFRKVVAAESGEKANR